MFDISNSIAYGGTLMVYGTATRDDFPDDNGWIDVRSDHSQGNWIPAEGAALADLLHQLNQLGIATHDIRIVGPFRDVVRGVKDRTRAVFGHDFTTNNVGTIHTVQGQQSPVVILVLGSAPRNARAREWAADKPNLLNVAVSRAQRRLYVAAERNAENNIGPIRASTWAAAKASRIQPRTCSHNGVS